MALNNLLLEENAELNHSAKNIETLSIEKLLLQNFRNYNKFELDFAAKPVIITGHNGIGKTNILEAISFLSPGRGLRNAKLDEIIIRKEGVKADGWEIIALVNSTYGKLEVATSSVASQQEKSGKRVVKINDQAIKSHTELAHIFSVIWLTPQMDPLFIGSSVNRRRFVDRLVYNFDPEHASRVLGYENSMRQRAKLLKRNKKDVIWLSALEQSMAEAAVAIAVARVQTLEYLQTMINISTNPFPKAKIKMQGELEAKANEMPSLQLEEHYKKRLFELREIDFFTGRTNAGIHRSDLLVYHSVKNIEASNCSTGEQKALLLSIILAEARARIKWKSSVPVLLLDEVVAHLDETRREALFAELLEIKTQSFITGTDQKLFDSLSGFAQFIELKN